MTPPPDVVRTIVAAVVYKREGASFDDIAAAFPPSTPPAQVQDWISQLVLAGILEDVLNPHRYFATYAASPYLDPSLVPAAGPATQGARATSDPTDGSRERATRTRTRTGTGKTRMPTGSASAPDIRPAVLDAIVRHALSVTPPASSTPGATAGASTTPNVAANANLARSLSKLLSRWVGRPESPGDVARLIAGLAVVVAIPALLQVIGTSPWLTIAAALVVIALVLLISPRMGTRPPQDLPHPATPPGIVPQPGTSPQGGAGSASSALDASPAPVAATPAPPTYSRRGRYTLAGACLLFFCAIVSIVWIVRARSRPPRSEISAYLVATLAPVRVRVAALDLAFSETASGCRIAYRGMLQTTEPLFHRIPTSPYLSQHFASETAAIQSAGILLRGPDGDRIRSVLGSATLDKSGDPAASLPAGPASPALDPPSGEPGAHPLFAARSVKVHPLLERDLEGLLLVTTLTPPGTMVACSGVVVAWRHEGRWIFTSESSVVDRTRLAGERRPSGSSVYAVDFPDDLARLRTLLDEAAKDASRVQMAATSAAAVLAHDRQQRVESLDALLRPRTLYAGTYVDIARGDSHRVFLEITDASMATRKVTALLRNDGGWSDVRPFTGEWTIDPDGEAAAVSLRTRRADRIPGAGPLLDDANDASMVLQLRQDGRAVASDGKWRLQRVASDAVAALKTDVMRAVMPALMATRAGTVYRGQATYKATRAVETLILHFVAQDPDGAIVRATLQPESGGSQRTFEGRILDNTYRGASSPIRLHSTDAQAVAVANMKSLLAFRLGAGVDLDLRVDGNRLVGESNWFAYEFQKVDATETGAIAGANADVSGPGKGTAAATDREPATVADVPTTPARSTAVPQTRQESPRLTATTAVKPETGKAEKVQVTATTAGDVQYPRASGVYVLSGAMWKALPGSKGKQLKTAARGLLNLVSDLNLLSHSEGRRNAALIQNAVTEITFSDPGPVPTAKAGAVVIVAVGPPLSLPADLLVKHPELRTYPPIEMAPAKTLPTGARYAPIGAIVPGFGGFGADRVAGTIEQPAEDVTVLRCTAPLPRGRYVVLCGGRGYEVGVE